MCDWSLNAYWLARCGVRFDELVYFHLMLLKVYLGQ